MQNLKDYFSLCGEYFPKIDSLCTLRQNTLTMFGSRLFHSMLQLHNWIISFRVPWWSWKKRETLGECNNYFQETSKNRFNKISSRVTWRSCSRSRWYSTFICVWLTNGQPMTMMMISSPMYITFNLSGYFSMNKKLLGRNKNSSPTCVKLYLSLWWSIINTKLYR